MFATKAKTTLERKQNGSLSKNNSDKKKIKSNCQYQTINDIPIQNLQ
jgi:hypothetical protein